MVGTTGELSLEDRDELPTAALQQRLDYLGYRGNNGKRLVVDGIVGPETRHAIAQFKAAIGANGQTLPVWKLKIFRVKSMRISMLVPSVG